MDLIKQIVRSKNKITMRIPPDGLSPKLVRFGNGELSDLLGFGFSYVEQEDHCVSHVLVSPGIAKKIAQEIEAFYFTAETPYIGVLWTAQLLVTDRVGDFNILFSNENQSVVLDLNLNKMMEE